MGAGGIVHQRAIVLITAAKDSCLYNSLPADAKSKVDAIAAKDPLTQTQEDLEHLVKLLKVAISC